MKKESVKSHAMKCFGHIWLFVGFVASVLWASDFSVSPAGFSFTTFSIAIFAFIFTAVAGFYGPAQVLAVLEAIKEDTKEAAASNLELHHVAEQTSQTVKLLELLREKS